MKAWYYQDSEQDPREPHQYIPDRPVSLEKLSQLGVHYWTFDVKSDEFEEEIDRLCKEKNYKNRDVISIAKDTLENYEDKLKSFFTEHLHDDEEVRLILEGSGYFDVRCDHDEWIRIETTVGDMILLPAGIYHRFILDNTNYIKAMRIFKEDPKWTPINRSDQAESNINRLEYLECIKRSTTTTMH